MLNRLISVVTSWIFILCLAVLFINDWWLKAAYPNALTGKISDFAGIALVTLLALAAWPRRKYIIYACIALAFLWWKSPLSEPLIQFVNAHGPYPIGRVVDYTDLIALAIMPFCRNILDKNTSSCILNRESIRNIIAVPIAAMTIFVMMATSAMPTRQEFAIQTIKSSSELKTDEVAARIRKLAEEKEMQCQDCSHPLESAIFGYNHGIMLKYSFIGKKRVRFDIESYPECLMCFRGKSGRERADELRNSIKSLFEDNFEGLEYVEPLNRRR
jgi:hypothetical protein